MRTTQIENFITLCQGSIGSEKDLDRLTFTDPLGNQIFDDEEKDYILRRLRQELVPLPDPAALVQGEGDLLWYDAWLGENRKNRYHWFRVKSLLTRKLEKTHGEIRAGEIVHSLDVASDKILKHLAKPGIDGRQAKGLVLGYVQSGKTQNFTAVLAKAADTGYRLIIALAGVHDNLRNQTQMRLDCELLGMEHDTGDKCLGYPDSEHHWELLTRRDEFEYSNAKIARISGEFSRQNASLKALAAKKGTIIAIVKKNATILKRLADWLRKTDPEIRKSLPLLMIDDEADQASIDTNANKKDEQATATNYRIREILKLFDNHSYVGYTATPFANILINMETDHEKLGKDLYPRDFIIALNKPKGYWGAHEIFSSDATNILVKPIISDKELKELRDQHDHPLLRESIRVFFVACAIRVMRLSKNGEKATAPMAMLVHTTSSNDEQHGVKQSVEAYVDAILSNFADRFAKDDLLKEFQITFETEFLDHANTTSKIASDSISEMPIDFDSLLPYLERVLGDRHKVDVLEINSKSEDRLDADTQSGKMVIAVGGNKLSRGLTLEGLMVSFYTRLSKQYDTLLQMGRWFGYRAGYADLVRVYTTPELKENFQHLAAVERELRLEILRYDDEEKTPMDLAVQIKAHQTLQVTSKNKLGQGKEVQSSFSGGLAQTIWFPLDHPDILEANLAAGIRFVTNLEEISKSKRIKDSSYLWRDIPAAEILKFLTEYQFIQPKAEAGPSLDSKAMIDYIKRINQKGECKLWNVALVGQQHATSANSKINFGPKGLEIIPRERARLKHYKYKIGVLSDDSHLEYDDMRESRKTKPNHPLILLYVIWGGSTPKKKDPEHTEPLFKDLAVKRDVLGMVIHFPISKVEPSGYIGQKKSD